MTHLPIQWRLVAPGYVESVFRVVGVWFHFYPSVKSIERRKPGVTTLESEWVRVMAIGGWQVRSEWRDLDSWLHEFIIGTLRLAVQYCNYSTSIPFNQPPSTQKLLKSTQKGLPTHPHPLLSSKEYTKLTTSIKDRVFDATYILFNYPLGDVGTQNDSRHSNATGAGLLP